MLAYLKLLRLKNLIIVAFTQLFFQFLIIIPVFKAVNIDLALSSLNFFLLVLSTQIIAASGNIINDIFDIEIDEINNLEGSPVRQIGKRQAWIYYGIVAIIGAIISFYVANDIDNLKLFFIYPAAVALLFLYSYKFKHLPVLGNLVVSLFTALVIFILLFAERQAIGTFWQLDKTPSNMLLSVSGGFMIFAFLANWIREIVKDIEDLEGDRSLGSKTLPIVLGTSASKALIIALLVILSLALLCWPFFDYPQRWYSWNKSYLYLVLLAPCLFFIFKIYRAKASDDFRQMSSYLKIYMLAGLLYLSFYYIQ